MHPRQSINRHPGGPVETLHPKNSATYDPGKRAARIHSARENRAQQQLTYHKTEAQLTTHCGAVVDAHPTR